MYVYIVSTKSTTKAFLDFNILCLWLQKNIKDFHPFDKEILFNSLKRNGSVVKYENGSTVKRVELIYCYPDDHTDDDCFGSTD